MLELNNIVNVNVSQAPLGLGGFNVNNVGLFTRDEFLSNPGNDEWRAYVSASAVGEDFGTGTETYAQALIFFSQNPNPLNAGGQLIIIPSTSPETLSEALTRIEDQVFFVGIISTFWPADDTAAQAFALQVQATKSKIWIFAQNSNTKIAGLFTTLKNSGYYATRCLYYSIGATEAREFAAAYASRLFSTNFSAANGTLTMNLQSLTGIDADSGITQTVANNCDTAGVDIYANIAGRSSTLSYGANGGYSDDIVNLIWFITALQVAGFNALATVGTKIPQTEPGMSTLKNAYRSVCQQAVVNGYVAPGTWNSSLTFGNPTDFINNIAQVGFYIYSLPINQQSQTDREDRVAPLVQIAIKSAGAIHSTTVNVYINP